MTKLIVFAAFVASAALVLVVDWCCERADDRDWLSEVPEEERR